MGEQVSQRQLDLNGIYEIEYLEELMRIFGSRFLDEKSLYSPVEGRKEFHPQELEAFEPDRELRQEKLRRMTEKMRKILSPERINEYVAIQMKDRSVMQASELPLETMDDFMKMIYIRLYGSRKKMNYRIEKSNQENKTDQGFQFPDYKIIKRK